VLILPPCPLRLCPPAVQPGRKRLKENKLITPCYITSEMSEDLEEALQLGLKAGVDTVHLRKGLFGKEVQQLENEDLPRVQDTLGKFGAKVGVLMPPFAKCDIDEPDTINKHHDIFARTVKTAKALGTTYVRCFPFTGADDTEYSASRLDDYIGLIVDNLSPSVQHAESEGITMCFEVVNNTIARTAADTRKVIDALDSPAAKVIWEIDTGWRVGEAPTAGYKQIKGLIRDVHIKPNDKNDMDPAGDTGENQSDAIRQLHADGYEGYVSIEHWKGSEGILRGLRQLTDVLETLD
jgi:sugar phosphate isomerase/epimerase